MQGVCKERQNAVFHLSVLKILMNKVSVEEKWKNIYLNLEKGNGLQKSMTIYKGWCD